jgi:hypothetical protein
MNSYYQSLDDIDVIISDAELDDIYWKMDESNHITGRKGDPGLAIGASYGSNVIDIDKFVNEVMRTIDVAFEITQVQNGTFKVVELPLAKYYPFMSAFQACRSEIFRYSEPIELFFDCVKSSGLWGFPLSKPYQITTESGKTDGQLFNDLITLTSLRHPPRCRRQAAGSVRDDCRLPKEPNKFSEADRQNRTAAMECREIRVSSDAVRWRGPMGYRWRWRKRAYNSSSGTP